jgi:hypothetical protein
MVGSMFLWNVRTAKILHDTTTQAITVVHIAAKFQNMFYIFLMEWDVCVCVCGYVSETWTLSKTDETLLSVFERRILRCISGAVQENGVSRKRYNHELYELFKYTIHHWLLPSYLLVNILIDKTNERTAMWCIYFPKVSPKYMNKRPKQCFLSSLQIQLFIENWLLTEQLCITNWPMNTMYNQRHMLNICVGWWSYFETIIFSYYNLKHVSWMIRKLCKKQNNHATI